MFDSFSLLYRALRYRYKLDKNEIRFLLNNISSNNFAVDIGAHKGGYTYWMHKRVGSGGKILAFEPQKILYEKLLKLFSKKNYSNIILENKGISIGSDVLEFFIPQGKKGTSPGASLEKMKASTAEKTYKIEVVSLDEYIESNSLPFPDFIKCDVEGHELKVFKGAEKTLLHGNPILMFECEQRHHQQETVEDVFAYLSSLQYSGFFFSSAGDRKSIKEFSVEKHQLDESEVYVNNFIFIKENLLSRIIW